MDFNPYQSPEPVFEGEREQRRKDYVRSPGLLMFEWVAVLLFNLIVPLLFAWSMTNHQARLGCAIAIALAALVGAALCRWAPSAMLIVIRGGVFVAVSQVFPALQIIAGALSFSTLSRIGMLPTTDVPDVISSTFGGFMVTLSTGILLLAASCVFGIGLWMITPKSWWVVFRYLPRQEVTR